MKVRRICNLLILLMSPSLQAADQPSPAGQRIDAYLEPDGEVYVGQQLRLIVHLETDTWFSTAPRYPEIQIPGAIVLQPEAFAVNSSRREGGRTWTGQRQRYVIFPQRSGILTAPSIKVTFSTAADGRPGPPSSLSTPPVSTGVRVPPGSDGIPAFVTATNLTVRESWEKEPAELLVGDALVRTITRQADGTFALLLPSIRFPDLEAIASYPAPPRLEDSVNRGRYSATRVDQVSYLLQQAGTFKIPAMVFHWFDLTGQTMRTVTLPAVAITVAENPAARVGQGATKDPSLGESLQVKLELALRWLRDNLAWLTVGAAFGWLLRWSWLRIRDPLARYFAHRRHQRRFGEPARFAALRRAARHNDQDGFIGAFWSWSDRLPGRSPPLTGAALLGAGADSEPAETRELTRIWEDLNRARYRDKAPDGLPQGTTAALTRIRKRWFTRTRPQGPEAGEALNP